MTRILRLTLTLLLCLSVCLCLLPAAYADGSTVEDLQRAIADGAESFTVTGDMTIPANTTVDASGLMLFIPEGVTLTVDGTLIISDFSAEIAEDWDQSGYLTVSEGGRLHLTRWMEIANFMWDMWLDDETAGRITYDDGAGFELFRWVEEPGDGIFGLDGAFRDAQNYCRGWPNLHFSAELAFEWTVDQPTTIPNCVTVIAREYGIRIAAPLVNNGEIELGEAVEISMTENGSYSGYGRVVRNGEVVAVDDLVLEGLIAACGEAYEELAWFGIPEGSTLTITEDLVIPENLRVDAIGSGLHVSGAALTINGDLICSQFLNDGGVTVNGVLYVERSFDIGSGSVHLNGILSMEHDAFDPGTLVWEENFFQSEGSLLDVSFNVFSEEELRGIMFDGTPVWGSGFQRSFWMFSNWTLAEDLTLPAQTRLCISAEPGMDASLLIPEGRTLTIPEGAALYARGSGPETQDAAVQVNGALVNNGRIELDWGDTLGDIALGENGSYSGSGEVLRDGKPYDIEAESEAFRAFVTACSGNYDEPTDYDIEGEHVFTIRSELTIPDNLSVYAPDTLFEVSFPGSLTIAPDAELITAAVEAFGELTVDGYLDIDRGFRTLDNRPHVRGQIVMTLDAWVNWFEFTGLWDPVALTDRISFESDDALLDIWVEPGEDELAATLDFGMFQVPHVRETILIGVPWILDHDRTLDPARRYIVHYGGGYEGTLTIPEGMTLTIPEGSEILARGAAEDNGAIVKIYGELVNEGVFHLHLTRAGTASVAFGRNGRYSGGGEAFRLGEPYTVRSFADVQLVLPEELAAIEGEAFADDSFTSVYIPAGTTAIDPDAFAGVEDLTIWAVRGSPAQRFADEAGFGYAEVLP